MNIFKQKKRTQQGYEQNKKIKVGTKRCNEKKKFKDKTTVK